MNDSNNVAELPPEQNVAGGDASDTTSPQTSVEAPPEPPEVQLPSVGQLLRAARLEAKLSITDVAQVLKYSPRQIELIELDNHAALPGMTIVRGFVRSYARLLRLDAEALLKMLDTTVLSDVRPPDNMGLAAAEGDRQQIGPVVSLAIVVLLAALMLAGWHFFGPKPLPAVHSASVSTPATVAPPSVVPLATPADAAAPAAQFAPSTLTFVFEGRSWLEVTDADAKVVHSAENQPGTQLSLTGKPPFDLVVGNATKVKLTYGERVIDLLPYTRADVARLKVE